MGSFLELPETLQEKINSFEKKRKKRVLKKIANIGKNIKQLVPNEQNILQKESKTIDKKVNLSEIDTKQIDEDFFNLQERDKIKTFFDPDNLKSDEEIGNIYNYFLSFIFEILQNSDDANANSCDLRIKIKNDGLFVEVIDDGEGRNTLLIKSKKNNKFMHGGKGEFLKLLKEVSKNTLKKGPTNNGYKINFLLNRDFFSNFAEKKRGKTNFVSSIKEFFSFENDKGKLKIPELEGKNIADIGAGFSDSMNFFRGVLGQESKIICVDGIYDEKYIENGKKIAIDVIKIEIFNIDNIIKKIFSSRSKIFLLYFKNIINNFKNKKNTELYGYKIFSETHRRNVLYDLNFVENWEKEEGIEYKTELEKSDNIDVAFCRNLFYKIPEPVQFLTKILENLNDKGELFIIDYPEINYINLKFLDKLYKNKIIDGYVSFHKKYEYIIFKINKEKFLGDIFRVQEIYNNLIKSQK